MLLIFFLNAMIRKIKIHNVMILLKFQNLWNLINVLIKKNWKYLFKCFLWHYEKSFSSKPHYPTTKAPKQLIYNYSTTRAWKYGQLINKIPHKKIKELFNSCNLTTNGTLIWCNVCIIHTNVVNHVWFFCKLHFNCMWQLH
jgi:hypothetical protein